MRAPVIHTLLYKKPEPLAVTSKKHPQQNNPVLVGRTFGSGSVSRAEAPPRLSTVQASQQSSRLQRRSPGVAHVSTWRKPPGLLCRESSRHFWPGSRNTWGGQSCLRADPQVGFSSPQSSRQMYPDGFHNFQRSSSSSATRTRSESNTCSSSAANSPKYSRQNHASPSCPHSVLAPRGQPSQNRSPSGSRPTTIDLTETAYE